MVTFEISVNGEPLPEPMECDGVGKLMVTILWSCGPDQSGDIVETAYLGRSSPGQDSRNFSIRFLSVGDEITLRIVDRQGPDIPPSRKLFSN